MSTVPTLSTPPSRSDPTNFNTRADAFLSELPPWGNAINVVAGEVNTNATTASTAASTATTKAGEASTSASSALASKNAAASARDEAVTLTESYQGSRASDPTLDKGGNPISAGDWYINTTTGFIRVYTGSTWVQGISSIAGVSSLNGLTGVLTGFVTESATQSLSNKTLSSPTNTGSIYNNGSARSNIVAVAALNIDCSLGNYFTKTISTNSTFTFSNAPASLAYAFTLEVTHSSGVISWPASVQWAGGLAPTLTSGKTHLIVFVTDDGGSRWRGVANVNFTN